MNEPLARFLISLAGDVHRLDQFDRGDAERQALLAASGLPMEDQRALLSRDVDRIYDALQGMPDDAVDTSIYAAAKLRNPGVKGPGVKKPGVKKPGIKKPGVKKPGVKKR